MTPVPNGSKQGLDSGSGGDTLTRQGSPFTIESNITCVTWHEHRSRRGAVRRNDRVTVISANVASSGNSARLFRSCLRGFLTFCQVIPQAVKIHVQVTTEPVQCTEFSNFPAKTESCAGHAAVECQCELLCSLYLMDHGMILQHGI